METQNDPVPDADEPNKPGAVFLSATILIVAVNALLGFNKGRAQNPDLSYAIGSGMSALLVPLILVALFSIAKGFRNPVSRTKVVFWTSIVVLLSNLAAMGQHIRSNP